MRILFFIPQWNAPSEVFLVRQLEMLRSTGSLAGILLPEGNAPNVWHGVPVFRIFPEDHQPKRLRDEIFRAVRYKLGWRAQPVNVSQRLQQVIDESDADTLLIHFGTLAERFSDSLSQLSIRKFLHIHGGDIHWQLHEDGYRERLVELMSSLTVICNSQWSLEHLREAGITNTTVNYLGVEVPDEATEHPLDGTLHILHLGRLIDVKSPDRTIQAFDLACQQGLDAHLTVAGDGPMMHMCQLLRARSHFAERIDLPGAVDRTEGDKLRQQAHIFTQHAVISELTGQVEAFGVALVEAMAATLPVVTCPVGGIPETVIDGETGIFFSPGDIHTQAEAFLRLAEDDSLRMQLGINGWRRARDNFSVKMEQERLLAILQGETT